MTARVFMVVSAGIVLVVGALHFYSTFFDSDLSPRDPALKKRMNEVSPVVTHETTMWRSWIGFNAGFGMGAMLFGLIYSFLAVAHSRLLFGSRYLLAIGFLMVGGFTALSKVYLFRIPFICMGASAACFVASVIMSRRNTSGRARVFRGSA